MQRNILRQLIIACTWYLVYVQVPRRVIRLSRSTSVHRKDLILEVPRGHFKWRHPIHNGIRHHQESNTTNIWGHCCHKQVSQAGISNYIPQFTVGCNYLSLPEIPASGNKVLLICGVAMQEWWSGPGLVYIRNQHLKGYISKIWLIKNVLPILIIHT